MDSCGAKTGSEDLIHIAYLYLLLVDNEYIPSGFPTSSRW